MFYIIKQTNKETQEVKYFAGYSRGIIYFDKDVKYAVLVGEESSSNVLKILNDMADAENYIYSTENNKDHA